MQLRRAGIVTLAAMLCGLTAMACADEPKTGTDSLLPIIAEGRGAQCVEDTGFMRRNHMELLMHQRDETMLKGVRNKQHSLKECLNCHAVYGPDSVPVTASSPSHFCRSCHDYAAVSIDCFECHASRPDPAAQNGAG
jgi:hypothetical protein